MGSKASKLLEEAQKTNTKEINLKEFNLKQLPIVMRSLKIFWINNNKISTVPDEIGLLSELEDFQIDGNQVSKINKVFFELKKITELSMSRNHLKEIPSDLGVLASLRTLSLEKNELIALPACLSTLNQLKTLNVGQNNIEYIFTDFVNIPALTSFTLFGNRLHTLPDSFGKMKTLQNLNLRSNSLQTLPLSFGQLESLTTLSLWDNQFTEFPEPLCCCSSLTELSFSNNNLIHIPTSIKKLTNLRKLYLQYNQIETLPTDIKYLKNLNHLLLHHNKLSVLPCEISILKQIDSINIVGNPLPQKLISCDLQTLMRYLSSEMTNRREFCARIIQRHYRVWKKQFRFRSVVFALLEANKIQKNIQMANHTVILIRSAIKIQRWYSVVSNGESVDENGALLANSNSLAATNNYGGRLGSLFGFDEPDSDDNIIYYSPNENLENLIIRAATVPKLVEQLCNTSYTEPGFSRYFFATYPSFIDAIKLFQLLCVRYHIEPPVGVSPQQLAHFRKTTKPRIQERVMELMEYWIKNHLNDFQENPRLLKHFNSFITNTLLYEKEFSAKRLIAIFNETKKKYNDNIAELIKLAQSAPKPILPLKPPDGEVIGLMDISTIEIARQMALIDQTLLSKITATELLSKKWNSKYEGNHRICPNILNMIGIFNHCSKWVSSEIVGERSSKRRIKKLKFFIKIAQHCYDMNNFNGLMLIISGLSSSSVTRLRGTWGGLSSHRRERFDALERFVNMEGNFKQYRVVLSDIKGPCIPFVGLYLMDLTFMDEGNPSYVGELVNFVKKRLEANSILRFLSFKNIPYCYEPVPFIQDIVLNSVPLSEKELYDKSIAIEKRHLRKITKKEDRERKLSSSHGSSGDLSKLVSSTSSTSSSKSHRHHRHSKESSSNSPRPSSRLTTSVQLPTKPPPLKKGDTATTSSPAIISSPPKPKVPLLEFTLSTTSNGNTSPIFQPQFHSISSNNTPISSPRFHIGGQLTTSHSTPISPRSEILSSSSPPDSPRGGYHGSNTNHTYSSTASTNSSPINTPRSVNSNFYCDNHSSQIPNPNFN
eukprot:gene644-797_t